MMEDAGFENVELRVVKRPMNDWPKDPKMKEIGRVSAQQDLFRSFFRSLASIQRCLLASFLQYCCLNWLEGLEGFTLAPFTRILGWKPEEVQILLAQVRKESVTRRIHSYHRG